MNALSLAKVPCFVLISSCQFEIAENGQIGVINLNRPNRKNAFGRVMVSQLREAIEHVAESKEYKVVVLQSLVERCFSAGADLKERAEMRQEDVCGFVDGLRETFSMVEELPVPTIAAIDGVALGGGFELALCCDIRYAGSAAKIGLPETRLAILPAAGGSQRLPRLIGSSKAKELIFTATILGPTEAEQYGVVNASIEVAVDHAMKVAKKIAENGSAIKKRCVMTCRSFGIALRQTGYR